MRLLDASDLETALEIHKRCYRTLGWIEDALREELPVFLEEHGPIDDVEAAGRAGLHGPTCRLHITGDLLPRGR